MSNLEQIKSVAEAVETADARVNVQKEDIPAQQKTQIAKLENSIRSAIENYKGMGIYAGIEESFVEVQASEEENPEFILQNLVFRFNRIRGEGDLHASEALRNLAIDTLQGLEELKAKLTYSAGQEIDVAVKAERAYQEYLPEYTFDPSNISETLASIGEALGQRPKIEKLQGYEKENDTLLSSLRESKNASQYASAAYHFRQVTGYNLENVKNKVIAALKTVESKLPGDPVSARKEFTKTFAMALDTFSMVNEVLTHALFSKPQTAREKTPEHTPETEEASGELLTENEMAVMLNIMLYGAQDKSFLRQLFDISSAYETTTGRSIKDAKGLERCLGSWLGQVQGTIDAGIGLAEFAAHISAHPDQVLGNLAQAARGLLKSETYSTLLRMAQYGWGKTTSAEKAFFINKLAAEFVASSVMFGAAFNKIGALGKLSKNAAASGMAATAETLSLALNPVLHSVPRLARYGATAATITRNIAGKGEMLAQKAAYLSERGLHQTHRLETYESKTAGASREAKEALARRSPIEEQIGDLAGDIETAMVHAEELGLDKTQVFSLQSTLQELTKAA